jgi:hypothetical protein
MEVLVFIILVIEVFYQLLQRGTHELIGVDEFQLSQGEAHEFLVRQRYSGEMSLRKPSSLTALAASWIKKWLS